MAEIEAPDAENPYLVIIRADGVNDSLDNIDDEIVKLLYIEHGAVLFRGFNLSIENFGRLAKCFTTHATLNESRNREMLCDENRVQTVALGGAPFPLHPELSRRPWKPDVCFFGCLNPPSVGGETTICDGTLIAEGLPNELRQTFEGRRLMYMEKALPKLLEFWVGSETPSVEELARPQPNCPLKFARVGSDIASTYVVPVLHKTMFSDALAWGNFLFFNRYLQKRRNFPVFANGEEISDDLVDAVKAIADRYEYSVKWQKGDVLMLDNTRFMHGRKAVDLTDGREIITYFGYLKFAIPGPDELPNAIWRDSDRWTLEL